MSNAISAKTVFNKYETPKELFFYLVELWRKEFEKEEKLGPQLVAELSRLKDCDICWMAGQAVYDGVDCHDVLQVFENTFVNVDHTLDGVLYMYKALYVTMGYVGAAYSLYNLSAELVKQGLPFSSLLLEGLLKSNEPFVTDHIAQIYMGIAPQDFEKVHQELLTLAELPNDFTDGAVIQSLGKIKYHLPDHQKLLKKSLEILSGIEERHDPRLNAKLIAAYESLMKISSVARDRIVEISKNKQPETAYELYLVLLRAYPDEVLQDWYSEILNNLSQVKNINENSRVEIDLLICKMVKSSEYSHIVELFFKDWLIANEYNLYSGPIEASFQSTMYEFRRNVDAFQYIITRLLISDSFEHHCGFSSMVNYFISDKCPAVRLDKIVLKTLKDTDYPFIMKKILGYVCHADLLCTLIMSIFDALPRNKNIQGYVINCFQDHIGYDYPTYAIEFLQNEAKKTKGKIKKEMCTKIVKHIEKTQKNRDDLQFLKELQPPSHQSRLIALTQNRQSQEMMKKAQETSIMNDIVTKVPLKYGMGSFSANRAGFSEVSPLQVFSNSWLLPFSERSNPVYAQYQQFLFRTEKRGK